MKRFMILLSAFLSLLSTFQPSFAGRYYDSRSARWLIPDPALRDSDPQKQLKKYGYKLFGSSPYGYSFGNPVRYTDPDGKFPWPIILAGIYLSTHFSGDQRGGSPGLVQTTVSLTAATLAPSAVMLALRNPATTAAVSTGVAQALMPGTEGVGIGVTVGKADYAIIGPGSPMNGGESWFKVAEKAGASFFRISEENATKLGAEAVEKANYRFLDWGAKQGMEFRLSTGLENISKKSFTHQEIDYLQKQWGYTWNKDKTALIAPQQ